MVALRRTEGSRSPPPGPTEPSPPESPDASPPVTSAAAVAVVAGPARLTGTALTVVGFLAVAALLSLVPGVPGPLRPLDLDDGADRAALAARLIARPKMTLVEHEQKLAGENEVPDLADSHVVDAAEEAELHQERNGADDLRVLADNERAPPAAENEGAGTDAAPGHNVVVVDRGAYAARPLPRSLMSRARRSHERGHTLQMPGARIENPCVEPDAQAAGGCRRTALDPFFATLDALARGPEADLAANESENDDDSGENDGAARASVVVFGNSLIASDHVTDVVRDELQGRFGDGGRGHLLVDRLSKVAGRRVRTGTGSEGWIIRSFAQEAPVVPGVRFGFAGSLHEASVDGETTTWTLERSSSARLSWLDTGAGLRLTVDGAEVLRVPRATGSDLAAKAQAQAPQSIEVRLPPLGKELKLVADKGARVFGVSLERDAPGVVVDTIGVPAASARLYLDGTDADLFVAQVAARDPALVTLMLGGNETRGISYGNITAPIFEEKLTSLIDRLRQAAPRAACLIVTPIDAAKTTTGSDELVTRDEIASIIDVERRVAAAKGCALFDLFAAMGGKGSLARMRDGGFVSDDLVHPTARGGDVLGQLFADALVQSWADTAAPSDVPGRESLVFRRHQEDGGRPRFVGLSFPADDRIVPVVVGEEQQERPAPLSRFFARLSELDGGTRSRVAIGQFGASHTAGQMLTDRIRERMGARFGSLGRGFVSVGKASKRLAPSGVFRELIGSAEVADGREVVFGGALGMSGTKTRLLPGARFRVGFCQGCQPPTGVGGGAGGDDDAVSPSEENGRLQLAWLYTPDMGTADVLVDGVTVATLTPRTRRLESDVQFLSLPVHHEKAVLEVVSRKDALPIASDDVLGDDDVGRLSAVGPVHLLSVTEEMDRRGIVLDAVGLPGTTGMTPQRWRQDLYAEEVRARRYDLIVTAWGTNEAGIASLDEATYRHHFGATLKTLLDASPDADCIIVGASDRFDEKNGVFVQAPSHDLVERVQRELAASRGCAFFSLRDAMGGPGSMLQWVKDGVGHPDHVHFTREGYQKLADAFVDDLLAAWQFEHKQAQPQTAAKLAAATARSAAKTAARSAARSAAAPTTSTTTETTDDPPPPWSDGPIDPPADGRATQDGG